MNKCLHISLVGALAFSLFVTTGINCGRRFNRVARGCRRRPDKGFMKKQQRQAREALNARCTRGQRLSQAKHKRVGIAGKNKRRSRIKTRVPSSMTALFSLSRWLRNPLVMFLLLIMMTRETNALTRGTDAFLKGDFPNCVSNPESVCWNDELLCIADGDLFVKESNCRSIGFSSEECYQDRARLENEYLEAAKDYRNCGRKRRAQEKVIDSQQAEIADLRAKIKKRNELLWEACSFVRIPKNHKSELPNMCVELMNVMKDEESGKKKR